MRASCMLCGREGTAGATCRWCAVPLPTPLDEPKLRVVSCARCGGRMQAIGISPKGESKPAVLHVCRACRGMFIPPRAWHVLLTRPDRIAKLEATLPPSPSAPSTPGANVATVRCPACTAPMDRVRFAGVADVVVDTCVHRHGVWLDPGELRGIARFKAERDEVGTHFVRLHREASDPIERMRQIAEQHVPPDVLRRTAQAPPPPPAPPWWRTRTARLSVLAAVVILQLLAIRCTRSGAAVRDGQSLVKQAGPSAAGALGR